MAASRDGALTLLRSRQRGSPEQGSMMSCCSPRNVIVINREQAPFAAYGENLPIGREYRSAITPRLRSGVSLRVFTEREGEGS